MTHLFEFLSLLNWFFFFKQRAAEKPTDSHSRWNNGATRPYGLVRQLQSIVLLVYINMIKKTSMYWYLFRDHQFSDRHKSV
jgi:hypothetical protein